MRHIYLILLLLVCVEGLGQTELARINDPDGYTNFRKDKGSKYEIKGKFLNGDIFITVPSSDEWWLTISYNNVQGYIHKSRIRLIKNLPANEIRQVILMSFDTLKVKIHQFESTNWDSSKLLFQERRNSLENYEEKITNRIYNLVSEQFCKYSDSQLLDIFMKAIIENRNSANESPAWTMGECYICNPDIVIRQISKFPQEETKILIEYLDFGFANVTYQKETQFHNYKALLDKLDKLKKKAKL
jgi:hypothetical protein